jgi:hypothetical protein
MVDLVQPGSGSRATFRERLNERIQLLREFADGLEYQRQFTDHQMLETLERDGAGLFRLAKNCLSRERRLNSSRSSSPTTWERTTSNALYYRARPRRGEEDTCRDNQRQPEPSCYDMHGRAAATITILGITIHVPPT